MPYIGKGANGFGIRETFQYTATSNQTAFTGSDINSKTLSFDNGSLVDVLLNGVMLKPTTDYNTSTANTITLVSGASTSDEVMIVVYDVFSLSDALSKSGGAMSGSITNFTSTGIDDNADATAITIDSSERVGIGEASPSAPLHIETGTTTDILRFGANGRWGFQRANSDSRYLSFSRAMNGTASSVLTVDGDNGNVGIGDTTPTSPLGANYRALDINSGVWGGTVNFSGNSGGYIGNRHSGNGGLGYYASSSQGHFFHVNGTTDAVVTMLSDGRVGVGDGGQTNVRMTLTENTDTDTIGLKATTGASSFNGITIWSVHGSSIASSAVLYGGYANSAHKFIVRADGDIETAGSTSLSGISDINFKENVVDANSQWDDIKALKVRNYSWKEDKLDKADKIGLIAQEAELVSPNLVFTRDKINDVQYIKDENGKDIDNPDFGKKIEGETYKTLKYSVLYTKALKALQEAMERIETLEAKVKALEEASNE
jgi:hypothetical protein